MVELDFPFEEFVMGDCGDPVKPLSGVEKMVKAHGAKVVREFMSLTMIAVAASSLTHVSQEGAVAFTESMWARCSSTLMVFESLKDPEKTKVTPAVPVPAAIVALLPRRDSNANKLTQQDVARLTGEGKGDDEDANKTDTLALIVVEMLKFHETRAFPRFFSSYSQSIVGAKNGVFGCHIFAARLAYVLGVKNYEQGQKIQAYFSQLNAREQSRLQNLLASFRFAITGLRQITYYMEHIDDPVSVLRILLGALNAVDELLTDFCDSEDIEGVKIFERRTVVAGKNDTGRGSVIQGIGLVDEEQEKRAIRDNEYCHPVEEK